MTLWSERVVSSVTDEWGAVWALTSALQNPTRYGPFHNVGAGNGDDVADAVSNPSWTAIVYCITPLGAGASQIIYLSPLSANQNGAGTVLDTNPSSLVVSMHPYWCPANDDLVVYRTMDDSPFQCEIRKVVPSTATVTSLKTISRTLGDVIFPRYNFDGSRIAYGLDDDIWIMNADGTGATQVVTGIGANLQGGLDYAWSPVADELAYCKTNGEFRRIQGDGSGDTLLYTDSSPYWGFTLYPWSSDGQALYFFKRDQGSDPEFSLWGIDAVTGGAGQLSPLRLSWGGGTDRLAYVYSDRIYWQSGDDDATDVVSCDLTGAGLRTEITFGASGTMTTVLFAAKSIFSGSNLYTLDPASGASDSIGSTGRAITGLAQRPSDGVLFAVTTPNSSSNPTSLLTLDKDTGAATLVGALTGMASGGPIPDIAFASDDTLYGYSANSPRRLHTINTSTGVCTEVSTTEVPTPFSGGGLACTASDELYLFSKEADGIFYLVDRATGTLTAQPALTGATSYGSFAPVNSASFGEDGLCWVIVNDQDLGIYHLAQVDVATASIVDVAAIANNFDALAWGDVAFNGIAIDRFVSGFYYWLNQPS